MSENPYPEDSPMHHTTNVKEWLHDLIDHLREDVGKVDDSKAEALFETTAEVLGGLVKAFEHYEKKSEEAWK